MNKRTLELQTAARAAVKEVDASGLKPLDFMLAVMRDPNAPLDLRFEAAKSAAPYLHARLASIEHGGKIDLGLGARLEAAMKRVDEVHLKWQGRAPEGTQDDALGDGIGNVVREISFVGTTIR